MKKLVIYSGGFHPFGLHHYNSYLHLCEKFGKSNVFVATSDYVTEQRPLNFEQKKMFAKQYGVELFKVKSPYKCTEITEFYNPSDTQLIIAVGNKDSDRITGKYYKPFSEGITESLNNHGFVYNIPHVSIKKLGKELSGTTIREMLSNSTPQQFKEVMGWYNLECHKIAQDKFSNPTIKYEQLLKQPIQENRITKTQLQRIEQYADKFFKEFGIDVNFQNIYKGTHFYDRLNDPRNGTPISSDELRSIFKKASLKHGYKLSGLNDRAEGVLKDMESDINMPFILQWDKENQEIDLVPKTIMRKKDFKSSTPVYSMEDHLIESVVQSAVSNRHIKHIYEDSSLDYVKLLNDLLDNKCELFEKFDGQSLFMTFRNNQPLASRNKTTIINPLTRDQLVSKFNPNVAKVFGSAFDDIGNAFMSRSRLFEVHNLFLQFEILHPDNQNVFYYGKQPLIVLHNLVSYSNDGKIVNEYPDVVWALYNELKSSNQLNQNTYNILPPNKLTPNSNQVNWIRQNLSKIIDYNNLEHSISVFGYYFLNAVSDGSICQSTPNMLTDLVQAATSYINTYDPLKRVKVMDNVYKLNKVNTTLPKFEGIVFKYNDNTYKLTGSFRYLNQIIGAMKYK